MKKGKFLLTWIIGVLLSLPILAQELGSLEQLNENRKGLEKNGMIVLGTWALGNMVWGGVGSANSSGRDRGFHQMNLYWNSVNLLIAGWGYYQASKSATDMELWESLSAQNHIEKVLLVNAALDLGYMAGGLFWQERGKRLEREEWIGFGKSVVLQGGFLLVFDWIMYRLQVKNSKKIPKILEYLTIEDKRIGFKVYF